MGQKRIFAWAAILALVLMVASPAVGVLAAGSGTNTTDSEGTSSVQYELSINSTEGGLVVTPGEGAFNHTAGTVVDLVATPDAGYRFVEWAGNVGTTADVNAASRNITVNGNYSITANFVAVEAGHVGIKAGDWIKITYNITGLPADQLYAERLKLEFLSVNGTIANARATLGVSDGTEESGSGPLDVVSSGGIPELPGIVVSANLTTGDSVPIAGYGYATIEGEATGIYAGANRTVVYAGYSQNETQLIYYWDKLTGLMVGKYSVSPNITATGRATETNMWGVTETTTDQMPWWPWIVGGG